ncbi:MAG: hypothetical protein JWM43_3757 [Acidobacteriaceae bacterium]|nr:hypothetical protein [Acidobacteriaceae bacterium]
MVTAPQEATVVDPATGFASEIQEVLESRSFGRSPVLRKLLLYLWEHRNADVSEYAVAVEALGRGADFDPATDATVRVTIARLRQKLRDHYIDRGKEHGQRLEIPLGGHQLIFVKRSDSDQPSPFVDAMQSELSQESALARPEPDVWSRPWGRGALIGSPLLAAFILFIAAFVIRHPSPAEHVTTDRKLAALQPWADIVSNKRPIKVVVPTPVFFSWKNSAGSPTDRRILQVRDVSVNDYEDIAKSPQLADFTERYGKPILGQSYTVISDTFASIVLTRFLDKSGFGDSVEVLDRAGITLPAVRNDNVIALGTTATLAPFADFMSRMNFALLPGEEVVLNRHPLSGESPTRGVKYESPERAKWPGIVAVLPGGNSNSVCILLISRHTSALAAFLTSKEGLEKLGAARKKAGSPAYFEAIIDSEMDADRLVSQELVLFHPFSVQ